ncbi:hypothetical protein Rhe02_97720 [Rhizocola hellebori]|uniref:DUF1343 domain-containing protein n=2 Tax=Rhizocola hellebori TaxID=1392758 RepID=A0A8J3QL37_9ACTN|nr:hypothetical protein Rhe02_97720 [Rhizocola hellebori]
MDRLVATDFALLAGQRVGVIANPTSVDHRMRHLVDLMHVGGRVSIAAVFGPEHGFRGSAQAGFSEGPQADARTGLTVYDAYTASEADWARMFAESGTQTVVFDIQDVGARFYTYIWTLYDSMCAAAGLGLRYVVLDRPNPLGGNAFGPVLQRQFGSFVGRREIAQQHGMTVGELARFYNARFLSTPVELEVVPCAGWRREALPDLPWVMPSPNMPTMQTALVYPGTGMFEGTMLSEGRGTTRPFELIGAPGLDHRWADRLNARNLPGVVFREAYFRPTFQKFADELCAGAEVRVLDVSTFDSIGTAVAMLVEASRYEAFRWREDGWIDKLTGSSRLRTMVDQGADLPEIAATWRVELAEFDDQRRPYLLYR